MRPVIVLMSLLSVTACGGGGSAGSGGGAGSPTPTPSRYSVGGTVSGLSGAGLTLRNGSDVLTVATNGSFSFPTQITSGTSYTVTVGTQPASPAQICDVQNGSGSVASANVTGVLIVCSAAPLGFFYVVVPGSSDGPADGAIYSFSIDAATGALTQRAIVAAQGLVNALTVTRSNRQIIVSRIEQIFASRGSQSYSSPFVQRYTLDPLTGIPTADTQIAMAGGFSNLLTHPDGVSLYGVSNSLAYFSLDTAPPSPDNGRTVPISANTLSGVMDAAGRYIYVPALDYDPTFNPGIVTVSLAVSSKPMVASRVTAPTVLTAIVLHPDRPLLYATSLTDPVGYIFDVSADGRLVQSSRTFAIPAGPTAALVTPSGKFLYIADHLGNRLVGYRIDDSGLPVEAGISANVPLPYRLVTDPDGKYLYAMTFGLSGGPTSIYAFAIGNDGRLTPVNGSPYPAGDTARGIAIARYTP